MRWLSVFLMLMFAACAGESTGADAGTDAGADAGLPAWTPISCLADPACPWPMVSAHRGLCGSEPENTLAAVLECEAQGVPMVEIDTRETADGQIVVMHDSDVTRTTDGETRFPDQLKVTELSLSEFAQLVIDDPRCAEDPDAAPARCHPPTFEALLLATTDCTFMLDYKEGDVTRLAELVRDLGMSDRVLFFEDNLDKLHAYRAVLPAGQVMGRASNVAEFQALIDGHHQELDFRWLHGEPSPVAEVVAVLAPHHIRLYLDTFITVDMWLTAADTTEDEQQKQEYLDQARQILDDILAEGALALGVGGTAFYLSYLYPNGFGR